MEGVSARWGRTDGGIAGQELAEGVMGCSRIVQPAAQDGQHRREQLGAGCRHLLRHHHHGKNCTKHRRPHPPISSMSCASLDMLPYMPCTCAHAMHRQISNPVLALYMTYKDRSTYRLAGAGTSKADVVPSLTKQTTECMDMEVLGNWKTAKWQQNRGMAYLVS